jgi:hypothetical protein
MPAYFDTNVIRYLQVGLQGPLSDDMKSRIVLSPLSAIELLSQVADGSAGEDALQSIHRLRDWLPEQAVLLNWLEPFSAWNVFGIELEDGFFPIISEMLQRALAAPRLSYKLKWGARKLRRVNEKAKLRKAELFQRAAERLRAEHLASAQLDNRIRSDIKTGLAQRLGAIPSAQTQAQIEQRLSAYCDFHTRSVRHAVENVDFRFESRAHLNDHFDGEQLLYLSSPENHFISSDTGFHCVANNQQAPQYHFIPAVTLRDPATSAPALQGVIAGCTPAHPAVGPRR